MKTIKIEIPESTWEAVYLGVSMIKNLRETGDHELSLEDARRRNKQVRPMSESQVQSVLELREVMKELLEARHR